MNDPGFGPEFQTSLRRLFALRRDVRRFRDTPVAHDDVRALLDAAHLAPSVGLSQPWRFVLVESPALRQQVAASFARENERCAAGYEPTRAQAYRALKLAGLEQAPVHLLVCCEREPTRGAGLGRQSQPETVPYSAVCAVQNLWLAARAHGLGVGWVSILDPAALREPLALPDSWQWIAYLCIGYPVSFDEVPELETARWQTRTPLADVIFTR